MFDMPILVIKLFWATNNLKLFVTEYILKKYFVFNFFLKKTNKQYLIKISNKIP